MRIALLILGLTLSICASGTDSLRVAVAKTYYSQIGVREATGKNDGPQVKAYLAAVGLPEGYAWCGAFPAWTFDQHGIKHPKSGWVPSWFPSSKVIWSKGKGQTPKPADLFCIYYANLKRAAHMGFVDYWGVKWTTTVEGNTNDLLSRDGDGVYKKRRLISQIYKVSDYLS